MLAEDTHTIRNVVVTRRGLLFVFAHAQDAPSKDARRHGKRALVQQPLAGADGGEPEAKRARQAAATQQGAAAAAAATVAPPSPPPPSVEAVAAAWSMHRVKATDDTTQPAGTPYWFNSLTMESRWEAPQQPQQPPQQQTQQQQQTQTQTQMQQSKDEAPAAEADSGQPQSQSGGSRRPSRRRSSVERFEAGPASGKLGHADDASEEQPEEEDSDNEEEEEPVEVTADVWEAQSGGSRRPSRARAQVEHFEAGPASGKPDHVADAEEEEEARGQQQQEAAREVGACPVCVAGSGKPAGHRGPHVGSKNSCQLKQAAATPAAAEEGKTAAAAASGLQRPSNFVGVSWDKKERKWRANIRDGGKKKHLGRFGDEHEAARAVDTAARRLRGEDAHGGRSAGVKWLRLNFPSDREAARAQALGMPAAR
jgi:hypothetical protein